MQKQTMAKTASPILSSVWPYDLLIVKAKAGFIGNYRLLNMNGRYSFDEFQVILCKNTRLFLFLEKLAKFLVLIL
jgi:hypothetical protein